MLCFANERFPTHGHTQGSPQVGNVVAIGLAVTAALVARGLTPPGNPWRFCSADEFADLLEVAGLHPEWIGVFLQLTPLPDDLTAWLEVFDEPLLHPVPAVDHAAVVADAVALAHLWMIGYVSKWTTDCVWLCFRAARPREPVPSDRTGSADDLWLHAYRSVDPAQILVRRVEARPPRRTPVP